MENFINEIGTTNTIIILLVLIFVLLILVITFMCKTIYLDKKYKKFMKKLGESENLEEDLENNYETWLNFAKEEMKKQA